MSKPRPDLKNSADDIKNLIHYLSKLPFIEKIFINGSRSPLNHYPPRKDSDWDFIVSHSLDKRLILPNARSLGYHADVLCIHKSKLELIKTAIEIWPVDKNEIIFKNK